MRRIFSLVIFFLIFFFFNINSALAAVQCAISPGQLLNNVTNQDFTISSGGNNNAGGLSGGQVVDVYFCSPTDSNSALCMVNDAYRYAVAKNVTINDQGVINLPSVEFTTGYGKNMRGGNNMLTYVVPQGKISLSDTLCVANDNMKINIVAAPQGNICTPLNLTAVAPDGNRFSIPTNGSRNGHPTTNDKIILNPTTPTDRAKIEQFQGTHNVWVYNIDEDKRESSYFVNNTDSLYEFDIGRRNEGNYTIYIRNAPSFGEGEVQCSTSVQVSPEGGGIILPKGTTACPYCPRDSTWYSPSQQCIKTDGTPVEYSTSLCSPDTVCYPGHTDDGSVKAQCSPIKSTINNSRVDNLRNDLCPAPNIDGSCPNIPSGLGIDLPTDIKGFINTLLGVVLSLSGGIAIILVIASGYKLMVSQGNPEKAQGAKEQLTSAIVGLLFIVFSLVILEVVGYDILRLPGFGK